MTDKKKANLTSEAQLRAIKKYKEKNKPNIKRFTVDFYPPDHDLFDHIKQQPNQTGYVRELIRADVERGKIPENSAADKWVWADDGYLRCGNCGQKAPVCTQYQDEPETVATAFCPHCGKRMEGIANGKAD